MTNSTNTKFKEVTIREIYSEVRFIFSFLLTKWITILLVGFFFGLFGIIFAWKTPKNYEAKITFVVEDPKSNFGLSGLASLAGQFGVDVGGGSGGGLISGENVLLYFKSKSLARNVLLSKWENSNKSIADIYSESQGLLKLWKKNKKVGAINFPIAGNNVTYSRIQDSLLQEITDKILKEQFLISKIDKKAGFIEISIKMRNEKLAKFYCQNLVNLAIRRYVNLRTERQQSTVNKLQLRVDSITNLLYLKTNQSAKLQTSNTTMDLNPLYKTNNTVISELTNRDKTMLIAVYSEVVKNLEIAKFTLSQETPVIQIVDDVVLPLKEIKLSKIKFGLVFSIIGGFISALFLIIKAYMNQIKNKN